MKNNKGQMSIGAIVFMFMMIIVSIVLIVETFNQQTILTTKNPVINETIDVASGRSVFGTDMNNTINFSVANAQTNGSWQNISRCTIDGFTYGNSSTLWTDGTDYAFDGNTGTLTVINTTDTSESVTNTTFASYSYCQDGYNQDSSSRSIAGLIGLFAVFALLGFILWKMDILQFDV